MAFTNERSQELAPPGWSAVLRIAVPLGAAVLLSLGLHFLVPPVTGPFVTKLTMDIGINIILAVSLTLVNGFTGQFSIGHAGFMALGGYAAGAVTYYGGYRVWGANEFHGGILSWTVGQGTFAGPLLGGGDGLFVLACLVGGLVAAAAGYLVGLPSLRLRGDYLAIVTLGFGEIVRVLLQSTGSQLNSASAVAGAPAWQLAGKLGGALGFIGLQFYTTIFWVAFFVMLTLVVCFRLKRSSYGRAFLSIREDEIAAEAMGVRTTRFKVQAFVIAAFFAGIAGGLYAHEIGSINAGELGFQKSFDVLIMVVLGGMGSISGATLAAIILTLLPELLRVVAEYRMIVYALLLIIMMLVRPQGLFGIHELWELFGSRAARWPAGKAR